MVLDIGVASTVNGPLNPQPSTLNIQHSTAVSHQFLHHPRDGLALLAW